AFGELLADELRAADEAALLSPAARGDEAQERPGVGGVAGRVAVLQHVEERELLRVRAPDRLARGGEDRAALLAGHLAAHPFIQRHAIPLAGPGRLPRGADAGLLGRRVELGGGQDRLL